MAEVTVPMEEQGMLSSIMQEGSQPDAPVVETPQSEPEADRARDEHGRFVKVEAEAPKAEAPPAATPEPAAPQTEQDAPIPSWRAREMREARDEANRRAEEASRQAYATQQRMAEMQRQLEALQRPKAEPVDFFQNPDEALNQRIAPVQSDFQKSLSDIRLDFSRELAVIKHGEQTVTEVEAALQKAMQSNHPDIPSLSVRMRNSSNPVAVAIQWHQNNKLLETTGGNLETYKSKVLEEAMKDPAYVAKVMEAARAQAGQQPGAPNIQLPPSLNKATGAGMSNALPADGGMSDSELFKHAMSSPGGRAR